MSHYPDPEFYTRPLRERIMQLEDILRRSPCHLIVRESDEVHKMMGYGDRIMALEVQRLRDALLKIADGSIADKDVSAFAFATLDN